MQWFRFYDDSVNDPKVQKLPAPLFKTWVNLMCITSKNGGQLPSLEDIAFTLRMDKKTVTKQINELITAGLIDEDASGIQPHNWQERQFKSDSSADRMRRLREARKNGHGDNKSDNDVTSHVTRQEAEAEQNRTEQIDDDDCSAGEKEKNNLKIQEIHRWLENHFQSAVPLPSAPIVAWLAWGADFEIDIKPAAEAQKARQPDKPPRSLKWLDDKIAASIQQRKAPMPEVQARASPGRDYGQEATDKNDRILQELLRQQAENETSGSDSDDSRPDD